MNAFTSVITVPPVMTSMAIPHSTKWNFFGYGAGIYRRVSTEAEYMFMMISWTVAEFARISVMKIIECAPSWG
jgi:hypothetical protein